MLHKKRILISFVALICLIAVGVGAFVLVGSPVSDVTFTVADTLPDGEGRSVKVILLGGQSNASGCSRDDYLAKNVTSEKYAQYEGGFDNVYINYFATGTNVSSAFVKCGARQGEAGGYFGPELGMAEKLNEMYPDETFFIIKCAWGGSNLVNQWLSPSSDGRTGDLYRRFVNYVNTSIDYLVSKNYDVKIEAMCWMQGESDSLNVKHATDYQKNLENLISDIRDEFSEYASDDGIAFVDAYIADNPFFWVYCEQVNNSKLAVSDKSPINLLVDTVSAGLTCTEEPEGAPDVAHYDSLSELKLGQMFIEEASKLFD